MKNIIKHLVSFIAGGVNGLLGSGGGTVIMPILYRHLNNERSAHNTVAFYVLPLSIISASIYKTNVEFKLIFPLCIGAFFGGYIGLKLSKKVSVNFLKILFSIIIIYSGVITFL